MHCLHVTGHSFFNDGNFGHNLVLTKLHISLSLHIAVESVSVKYPNQCQYLFHHEFYYYFASSSKNLSYNNTSYHYDVLVCDVSFSLLFYFDETEVKISIHRCPQISLL